MFADDLAKRKIGKLGRRFGKTSVAARIAVEYFLKGRRVLYAVPTTDQMDKFWFEVNWALEDSVSSGTLYRNSAFHFIEVPRTQQRIKCKTAWNADMLRGDFADLLILDEFQLMNEDTWGVVGEPMLLDNDGDAIFLYTPPSLHSKSISKAQDPRHASKMFKMAVLEMEEAKREKRKSLWFALSGSSHDNPTLSRVALKNIGKSMTRLAYRQEIEAIEDDDVPGALWKRADIETYRWTEPALPDMISVVVAVDPPGGATECGIVTAGKAMCVCKGSPEMHVFVLEDNSDKLGPDAWANRTIEAAERNAADCIVGEKNFGGDMVKSTIKTADRNANVLEVHASRGKAPRAEPVSALYEQGKVHHVGVFEKLESEQCSWIPGISRKSPNRMDALVWAVWKLVLKSRRAVWG